MAMDFDVDVRPVPILSRAELQKLSSAEMSERRQRLGECLRVGEQLPEEEERLRQLEGIVFKGTQEWRVAEADLHHLGEVACLQMRAVPHVSRECLTKMRTRQLIGRLKALRRCIEALDCTEFSEEHAPEVDGILFKDSVEWELAYKELKDILATREHLPRGPKSRLG